MSWDYPISTQRDSFLANRYLFHYNGCACNIIIAAHRGLHASLISFSSQEFLCFHSKLNHLAWLQQISIDIINFGIFNYCYQVL